MSRTVRLAWLRQRTEAAAWPADNTTYTGGELKMPCNGSQVAPAVSEKPVDSPLAGSEPSERRVALSPAVLAQPGGEWQTITGIGPHSRDLSSGPPSATRSM